MLTPYFKNGSAKVVMSGELTFSHYMVEMYVLGCAKLLGGTEADG